ncbi:sugar phosphate nucleotidyltransferase [Paenibacillus sp. FSL K6-0276]|uniref:sugar phosphate nucleotidyltransferase n=1 Tax=unclassified Paenibacillus TaxID=185978 RepID=UPI0028AE5BB8|nr:sugar phosphate nucleotidyltransferase [Paenibacillus sp.]
MRIVLLCGGSGKRLWPLPNEIRSKVFLKLFPDILLHSKENLALLGTKPITIDTNMPTFMTLISLQCVSSHLITVK